ncbi:MAG: hypothetical protein JSR80_07770 [Verrucomicrobia bacterium]|nr:hypothetical protein [Verrucomicrobiota bacterium]
MVWFKRGAFALFCVSFATLAAQELILVDPELFSRDADERRLLEPFLQEQRDKTLGDKPLLRLSGDIRIRYRWRSESINGKEITVGCRPNNHPGLNFSPNRDRLNFNFLVDYATDCTWASIQLSHDNDMGTVSGTARNIDLERCLIGYTLYECGDTSWWIEAGRDRLAFKFDSEVQYGSRMDGIYFHYNTDICWADFIAKGAAFVIDYRCREYAYIGGVELEDINCRGYYAKYYYIDWGRHRSEDRFARIVDLTTGLDKPPLRIRPFRISQILIGRKIPCWGYCSKDLHLYAAFLYNHAAHRLPITANRKANIGFYTGFQYGKIAKACDWAVRLEMDYVQAQAILESDSNGIGRGNAAGSSIFEALAPATARGNTNYWGPSMLAGYAVTDEFTIRLTFVASRAIDTDIGGRVIFKEFQIQGIYAF